MEEPYFLLFLVKFTLKYHFYVYLSSSGAVTWISFNIIFFNITTMWKLIVPWICRFISLLIKESSVSLSLSIIILNGRSVLSLFSKIIIVVAIIIITALYYFLNFLSYVLPLYSELFCY